MDSIYLTWPQFKAFIDTNILKDIVRSVQVGSNIQVWIFFGGKYLEIPHGLDVGSAEEIDFTANYASFANKIIVGMY